MPAAPKSDPSGKGFVNFVDARWTSLGDRYSDNDHDEHDPIDGCTEEDVGWMRIAAMVSTPNGIAQLAGLPVAVGTFTICDRLKLFSTKLIFCSLESVLDILCVLLERILHV